MFISSKKLDKEIDIDELKDDILEYVFAIPFSNLIIYLENLKELEKPSSSQITKYNNIIDFAKSHKKNVLLTNTKNELMKLLINSKQHEVPEEIVYQRFKKTTFARNLEFKLKHFVDYYYQMKLYENKSIQSTLRDLINFNPDTNEITEDANDIKGSLQNKLNNYVSKIKFSSKRSLKKKNAKNKNDKKTKMKKNKKSMKKNNFPRGNDNAISAQGALINKLNRFTNFGIPPMQLLLQNNPELFNGMMNTDDYMPPRSIRGSTYPAQNNNLKHSIKMGMSKVETRNTDMQDKLRDLDTNTQAKFRNLLEFMSQNMNDLPLDTVKTILESYVNYEVPYTLDPLLNVNIDSTGKLIPKGSDYFNRDKNGYDLGSMNTNSNQTERLFTTKRRTYNLK